MDAITVFAFIVASPFICAPLWVIWLLCRPDKPTWHLNRCLVLRSPASDHSILLAHPLTYSSLLTSASAHFPSIPSSRIALETDLPRIGRVRLTEEAWEATARTKLNWKEADANWATPVVPVYYVVDSEGEAAGAADLLGDEPEAAGGAGDSVSAEEKKRE
ncbi:hypothetical protein JCM8097_009372 [Rhodosporidiobolus ruineniae]